MATPAHIRATKGVISKQSLYPPGKQGGKVLLINSQNPKDKTVKITMRRNASD